MKYILCIALALIQALVTNGQQKYASCIFGNEDILQGKGKREILNGPTRSLENLTVTANYLNPGKKITPGMPGRTDRLIIVMAGTIEISIGENRQNLGEGSAAVASSGDMLSIRNTGTRAATVYFADFRPFASGEQKKILPLFIDWNKVEFKPSANGGRRNIMQQATSFLKELEIHVTTLKEGLPSHNAHTHADEEIILMRKGKGEETINGKPFTFGTGSFAFLTNDDLHGIANAGKGECEYYAIRWLVY